jgi:hypothetical protein
MPSYLPLVVVLLLAGCAQPVRQVPPPSLKPLHELQIWVDHFHSAVIVKADDCDPALLPWVAPADPQVPWRAIHYGERAWMTDPTTGTWHAFSLYFTGGPGLVQMDRLFAVGDRDLTYVGFDPARARCWRFQVDERGWRAWQERLRQHWATGGTNPSTPGPATTYIETEQRWTRSCNCHDFTADLLRAAGCDLTPRGWYGARQLTRDLDRAVESLSTQGITVIGPPR